MDERFQGRPEGQALESLVHGGHLALMICLGFFG